MQQTVLFLCTGNYYRSRFAETLFNTLTSQKNLNWRAFSRGLAVDTLGSNNIGPISHYAIEALQALKINVDGNLPYPVQLREVDLERSDLVIALYEAEHRPFLEERFPQWRDQVEYWHVPDIGETPPEVALPRIEQGVAELINRLSKNGSYPSVRFFP